MSFPKTYLTIFLCAITYVCYAQEDKYILSSPIDLPQKGWNKVLCMKNGNTMLFHFDRNQPLVVKVYDSLHKEIATQKHHCKILDVANLENMAFKGLYEINGEAVLFVEQEHLSRHGLIRIRFNNNDGTIAEEKLAGESESLAKRTQFHVMKNKDEEGYAIFFSTDQSQFKTCNLHITYYNSRHEQIKDIPIDVDRKKYDYLAVTGAQSLPTGICITLNLMILVANKTSSGISPEKAIYDHHIAMYYIPKGSDKANKTVVDVSTDVYPNYCNYTYNPFANAINQLLYSYRPIHYIFGLNTARGSVSDNMFFKSDQDNGGIKLSYIKNNMASAYLQQKTDTSKIFYGIPLNMFTNENGLTTVISESYERYDEPETRTRYNYETFLGNICITQLDDDGNELWGTVLPHSEGFKSYLRYYWPTEFAKKREVGYPFGNLPGHVFLPFYGPANVSSYRASSKQSYRNSRTASDNFASYSELPEQVYQHQFLSLNNYYHGKDFYIIYNDDNKNFNNSIEKRGDTVYTFDNTNACYYKINRKREITKSYLFGEPAANEYTCSFIEGADFDDQRGVYATLVQYKKQGEVTLRMAWRHLE